MSRKLDFEVKPGIIFYFESSGRHIILNVINNGIFVSGYSFDFDKNISASGYWNGYQFESIYEYDDRMEILHHPDW